MNPIDKIDVWLGKQEQIDVYVKKIFIKLIPKARKRLLKVL